MSAARGDVDMQLAQADAIALSARQTEILEQITAGDAPADVLAGIAATLEGLVPGCYCSVLLLNRDEGRLQHGAAPSLPAEYLAGIDGLVIGQNAGSCGTAAYTGRAIVAADINSDVRWERFRPLAERFGLRACWSTPIHGRDGILGTFAVYHRTPHRPTPREEHLVERLSHLASVAIDHAAVIGALAESEERFRRAFEDNAVGMALATPDGHITRVNASMQTLLARAETELVGIALDDLFTHQAATAEVHEGSYRATTRTAHGDVLDVAVAVSAIRAGGDATHALCINVLDVTGQRAAERERHRRVDAEMARNAAEVANRAKTDFVAALGHELRTPLQAITGFTEVLGTLTLDDDRRSVALDHIGGAVDHILAMVDEVLDVARIEARKLPLTLEDIALAPVIDEVLAMVKPLATAERVTLRTEPSTSGVCVHADEQRVRQVLLNLLTNAIRYNRTDGVVFVGWRVEDHDEMHSVRVAVRDTGEGIASDLLDRLFVPFDRLGRDSDEGVGLGLPLARGLAEAMGGGIEVSSVVGHGTTVTMTLPPARRGGR